MDWHLIFVGAGVVLGAIAAVVGAFWKLLDLVVRPIQADICEIRKSLATLMATIRPIDDIERRTQLSLTQHASKCREEIKHEIYDALSQHERNYHK